MSKIRWLFLAVPMVMGGCGLLKAEEKGHSFLLEVAENLEVGVEEYHADAVRESRANRTSVFRGFVWT